jgi:hypothetical protein
MSEIEVVPRVLADRDRRHSYALRQPDAWLRWNGDGLLGVRVFLEPPGTLDERERAATLRALERVLASATCLEDLERSLVEVLGTTFRTMAWRPQVEDPVEMRATVVLHRSERRPAPVSVRRPPVAVPVERSSHSRVPAGSARDAGHGGTFGF